MTDPNRTESGLDRPRSRPRWLLESALVAFAAALLAWLLHDPARGLFGLDGYYHFKLGQLIAERGPWVDIEWLPLTVLGNHGPDHHWLFHVLLAPFSLFADPAEGIRWAVVASVAGVAGAFNLTARWLGVPWAPLFSLLAIAGGSLMPARLMMLRAQDLALVFLLAAIVLTARRRYLALALTSFLFMQAYHAATLLGVVFALDFGHALIQRRRPDLKLFVAMATGGLLGLVLSPWFPENVEYLLFHTLFKVPGYAPYISGGEWRPIGLFGAVMDSPAALSALIIGGVVAALRGAGLDPRQMPRDTAISLGLTLIVAVLYLKAWRFAEYFVPLAALSAGLLIRDAGPERWPLAMRRVVLSVLLGVATTGAVVSSVKYVRAGKTPVSVYQDVGRYLDQHAAPADLVFNSNWGDFVLLFWATDDLRFVNGLDALYLAYGDPDRYAVWYAIAFGQLEPDTDIGAAIVHTFGARWAVIPTQHALLAEYLDRSPYSRQVFRGERGWVYALTTEPLSP